MAVSINQVVNGILEKVMSLIDARLCYMKVDIMKTMERTLISTARESSHPMAIQTSLYDLIAALSTAAGPDEEDALTAAVVHLLNSHRVTCTGNLRGYRLVCDVAELATQSAHSDNDWAFER